MPFTMPEPRYFSIPSSVVGGAALRNVALNCRPWVRSLAHVPLAWTNSPALIEAAAPTTVTSSRWPRTLTRSTQKPVSGLWKVTRSTRPARASRSGAEAAEAGWAMLTSCGLGRDPVPGEQLQPAQALLGDPVPPAPGRLEPAIDVAVQHAAGVRGLRLLTQPGHRQGTAPLLVQDRGAAQGLLPVGG